MRDLFAEIVVQAWVLYRVLCRKRDPGTHRQLLHLVSPGYAEDDARFFKSFWSRLAGAVASQVTLHGRVPLRAMCIHVWCACRVCVYVFYDVYVSSCLDRAQGGGLQGD